MISSTGQTGGTISFGDGPEITGYNNAAGTAVSLAGTGGTVSFADLDITTTSGAGVNVGGITFAPGSTSTISANGGPGPHNERHDPQRRRGHVQQRVLAQLHRRGREPDQCDRQSGHQRGLDKRRGKRVSTSMAALLMSAMAGTIASSATGRSVQVQNHTGGAVTFSGSVTDTGLGINLATNTGGSITFSGASQTLNTGANNALTISANNGATISFSNLAITTTTGMGVAATGANSSVTLSGTNSTHNSGAAALSFTNTSGTYDYSGLTSSQSGIALAFDSTQTGTYNLGSLTIGSAPAGGGLLRQRPRRRISRWQISP